MQRDKKELTVLPSDQLMLHSYNTRIPLAQQRKIEFYDSEKAYGSAPTLADWCGEQNNKNRRSRK